MPSLLAQVIDRRRIVVSSWFSFAKDTREISDAAEGFLCMATAYLNRIATAVPKHNVHDAFVSFAETMLVDPPPAYCISAHGEQIRKSRIVTHSWILKEIRTDSQRAVRGGLEVRLSDSQSSG